MATFSVLILVAVLPALLVTVLGDCNFNLCLHMFSLVGSNKEFCYKAGSAVQCAESTLLDNPDCKKDLQQIKDTVKRAKRIMECYPCGATSMTMSLLTMTFGLMLAKYST